MAVHLHRPARDVRYLRALVALSPSPSSAHAVAVACRIAGAAGVHVTAVAAIEVPLDVPLEAPDAQAEAAAREAIRAAQEVGAAHGVAVDGVVLRARDAGEGIVDEAVARGAEIVVVAAERAPSGGRAHRLGQATDHVLKHAPCRVLLIGDLPADGRRPFASDPVFRSARPSDYWPAGEFVDAVGSTSR